MATDNVKRDLGYVHLFTGLGDGLMVPFVVGMLSLALTGNGFKSLIFLIAAAFVGAVAFGLARYFGELTEIEQNHPGLSASAAARSFAMMTYLGIESEVEKEVEGEMAQERALWLQEIEAHQLDWGAVDKVRAVKGGLQTGGSFLLGGLATWVIFFLTLKVVPSFSWAFLGFAGLSVLLLSGLVGGMRAVFIGRPFFKGFVFNLIYGLFSLSMPSLIAWVLIS